MLFTMQRYEFFSKSQLSSRAGIMRAGCYLPCKGTNFLANHNDAAIIPFRYEMLFTMQRYEFFSKSQLPILH